MILHVDRPPSTTKAGERRFSNTRKYLAVLIALLAASLPPSCRSAGEHFESQPWRESFEQFSERPEQWVPAAALFAATPLLLIVDNSTASESTEDQFFATNTNTGDQLALALGFTPILLGGAVGLTSGDTRYLEVTSEAIALTALETQFLKLVTNRDRPDESSGGDSFPSGHTSFSFCGATLLARWWADEHDGSGLGYLLYIPATYVGLSRLEGDRHFLSDITLGAALGMMTAGLVWNAHFGDEGHGGDLRSSRGGLSRTGGERTGCRLRLFTFVLTCDQ
jgi:membrane-associated phospholipid phosphatase